jgi:transcriptional regulator with XRE-family HTH domain
MNARTPSSKDQTLGLLVRQRRKELRLSQAELALAIGVSAQQIQKYERGDNRIPATRLQEIATKLDQDVQSFFDALAEQFPETAA